MTGLGLAQRVFFRAQRVKNQLFLRNHFVVWVVQNSTTLKQYGASGVASAGCCIATKTELDPSLNPPYTPLCRPTKCLTWSLVYFKNTSNKV